MTGGAMINGPLTLPINFNRHPNRIFQSLL